MPAIAAGGVLAAVVFVGFSGGDDQQANGIAAGTSTSGVGVDGSTLTVPGSTLVPVVMFNNSGNTFPTCGGASDSTVRWASE